MSSKFIAYSAEPKEITDTYQLAHAELKQEGINDIKLWSNNNNLGLSVSEEVRESIRSCDEIYADITYPNINVFYEIGLAIAFKKPVYLLKSKLINDTSNILDQVISDVRHFEYENYMEVSAFIKEKKEQKPYIYLTKLDEESPLFIPYITIRDNIFVKTNSILDKKGINLRKYDRFEDGMLSFEGALNYISSAIGVLIFLQEENDPRKSYDNCQNSFFAGIASGLRKQVFIFANPKLKRPVDIVDNYYTIHSHESIEGIVSELSAAIEGTLKHYDGVNVMQDVNRNASLMEYFSELSAENEKPDLKKFFVPSDDYRKIVDGSARLIVGRKGTGKSAIFNMVRFRLDEYEKRTLLIQLAPVEYQLRNINELIKKASFGSTSNQLLFAEIIWEYILTFEIIKRILMSDRNRTHEIEIDDDSKKLIGDLFFDEFGSDQDFQIDLFDVLEKIEDQITNSIPKIYADGELVDSKSTITSGLGGIAGKLRSGFLKEIKSALSRAIRENPVQIRILFDNLDKSFSPEGIDETDVTIIRGLINASRDLEKLFVKNRSNLSVSIFLRDDVYTHLMNKTSDRGKEYRISLDWQDEAMLQTLILKRFNAAGLKAEGSDFKQVWSKLFVDKIHGIDSWKYILHRSMMRPRFLIHILRSCMNQAFVVRNSGKVNIEDIISGCETYSRYLIAELGHELQDVTQFGRDIPRIFARLPSVFDEAEIGKRLSEFYGDYKSSEIEELIEKLLWFGFLGVKDGNDYEYIWGCSYDEKLLHVIRSRNSESPHLYQVHPAFWPHLKILT